MKSDLEIFNYFVDDILSSDAELLKHELDFLLMQYLFQSIDLEALKKIDSKKNIFVAWSMRFMKFFYEKFWVPFFGGILSKFIFLIEGKPEKLKNERKPNL